MNKKRFTNECFRLNLETWEWEQIKVEGLPELAYHTMTSMKTEKGFFFYIFGGIDNHKHGPSNSLFKLFQKGGKFYLI